jgi:hypothetical protein
MNEGHLEFILLGLETVQDEDKYTKKKEYFKYRKVLRKNEKQEEKMNEEQLLEIRGFAVV